MANSESEAWLNAAPISSLGLRMGDDIIGIVMGLCLGLSLCPSHQWASCGADVDDLGIHGLSCCFSKGHHSRHATINKRSQEAAKVPCHLEPTGLYRSDWKRSDGATVVPWNGAKVLMWDATCSDTLTQSHSSLAVREAGAVAADAENTSMTTHIFIPAAVEILGVLGEDA